MSMSKSRRTISGRTAVITGAASGIGRALAQRLSAHSCPVAIADVDEAGLKETEASLPGPALLRVLDVSDAQAQRDFAAEVRDWAPQPLGAVFNNAGVAVGSSVLDAVPEDDEWLWSINFGGVVNGTRAFLPILVEQDEGVVVNTSSVFGLVGMPTQSAYCAAKFAVRASPTPFAKSCAAPASLPSTCTRAGSTPTSCATVGCARIPRAEAAPRSRWPRSSQTSP